MFCYSWKHVSPRVIPSVGSDGEVQASIVFTLFIFWCACYECTSLCFCMSTSVSVIHANALKVLNI